MRKNRHRNWNGRHLDWVSSVQAFAFTVSISGLYGLIESLRSLNISVEFHAKIFLHLMAVYLHAYEEFVTNALIFLRHRTEKVGCGLASESRIAQLPPDKQSSNLHSADLSSINLLSTSSIN